MSSKLKEIILATKLARSISTIKVIKLTALPAYLLYSATTASSALSHEIGTAEEESAWRQVLQLALSVPTNLLSLASPNRNSNMQNVMSEKRGTIMTKTKIMSYHNLVAILTLLLCSIAAVHGLKCYQCGQYNEGVGSITPCLNYSDQNAHFYLKECSKKSEKYCVKYVSELSTVRDCATECVEKEIWETQTYCCTADGCNGTGALDVSTPVFLIVPIAYFSLNAIFQMFKVNR